MKLFNLLIVFMFFLFVIPFALLFYYLKFKNKKRENEINKHYAELLMKNDRLN